MLDAGHFAWNPNGDEIAGLMREFLGFVQADTLTAAHWRFSNSWDGGVIARRMNIRRSP